MRQYFMEFAYGASYIDLITGELHTQPGDIFYMGAYTYQNVRTLLYSGITGGAEIVLMPELDTTVDEVVEKVKEGMQNGKLHSIIISDLQSDINPLRLPCLFS